MECIGCIGNVQDMKYILETCNKSKSKLTLVLNDFRLITLVFNYMIINLYNININILVI